MSESVFLGLLALLPLGLLVRSRIQEHRQRRKRQEQFHHRAQGKGLHPAQCRLLWDLAAQQRKNPLLLLRFASAFELGVGECAAQEDNAQLLEELARIRVLLGFDRLPPDQPVRTTRQLAQGQTLSLWPQSSDPAQATPYLVISKDEQALITAPLLSTSPAWSLGTPLSGRFRRERDTEYRFATRLLALTPHTLTLQHADQVERLQAREFFRWETSFPLTLLAGTGNGKTHRLEGVVTNISGGGLRVRVQEGIPAGTRVIVDPQFRGPFPLAGVYGQVVSGHEEAQRGYLRLRFTDLPREVEAQIVRRIFQHQLGLPLAEWGKKRKERRRLQP